MAKEQHKSLSRRLIYVTVATVWLSVFLLSVAPAKATTVGSDLVFWCFDVTGYLDASDPLVSVISEVHFTGDLLDSGEFMYWEWLDELTDTFDPSTSVGGMNNPPSSISLPFNSPLPPFADSAWGATDNDIYLAMSIVGGTVNVSSVFLTEIWTQANGYVDLEIAGQAVPEPATMLLIGTGLVGLAGFRRKFKA